MIRYGALSPWSVRRRELSRRNGRNGGGTSAKSAVSADVRRMGVATVDRFLRNLEERQRALPPPGFIEDDAASDRDAAIAELQRRIRRGEFIRPAD